MSVNKLVELLARALDKKAIEELIQLLREGDKKLIPDAGFNKYWIVGAKANMKFRVPWLSERYMQVMEMTQEECDARKPHLKGEARPNHFIKGESGKALLEEVNLSFNERGEFETDDIEIARVAQQAARLTRRKGEGNIFQRYDYLHPKSKPIPPLESDKKNQKAILKPKTA